MRAKSISVVIVAEGEWLNLLPLSLNAVARQLYPLELIEVVIVTTNECYAEVCTIAGRFTSLEFQIVTDPMTGIHAPSYRKKLGWQQAKNEIFIGLDADVLVPAYIFSHIVTVLNAYPNFSIFSSERTQLTIKELSFDFRATFNRFEISEFRLANVTGRELTDGLYAKHPWTCASYLWAVKRTLLVAEDFVTAYDGIWGIEDNDLAINLYERGIHPLSHGSLRVLHWQHLTQSDDLYDAQLALLLRRHPAPYIVTRDLAFMYSRKRLPNWQASQPHGKRYSLAIQLPRYVQIVSSAVVLRSLYLALRTVAYNEGRPIPSITPLPEINPLLPHAYLMSDQDSSPKAKDNPAQSVNLWGLIYGDMKQYPPRRAYNIGYLPLEGEIIDAGYYSYLQLFDALWVSSERNAATLRRYGWIKPLAVIPLGIFSGYFYPHRYRPTRSVEYQFLTVGTGQRKQTHELIDTFAQTFSPSDRVGLMIGDSFHAESVVNYIHQHWPQWEEVIKVGAQDRSIDSISQLFLTSDAFITASRGEAWQLPVLEAMACAMPVIVPYDNGIPYVNETNAIIYHSSPVVGNAPFGYVEPDMKDLSRVMRQLVSNPEPAQQRARQLLEVVHTHYSWFTAARALWQWLDETVPHA